VLVRGRLSLYEPRGDYQLVAEALLPANVSLRHADALAIDLPALVADLGGRTRPVRLVANLPYSVGSVVLRRVLDARDGLAGWAVMLQKEVAERGIRVNAVSPSTSDTPANRSAMPDADFSTWTPPERIAAVMLWLASDEAAAVRGGAIPQPGRL